MNTDLARLARNGPPQRVRFTTMVGSYSYFFLNCTASHMVVCLERRGKVFYRQRLEPGEGARVRSKSAGKFAFSVCCRTDDLAIPTMGESFRTFWGESREPATFVLTEGKTHAIQNDPDASSAVLAVGVGTSEIHTAGDSEDMHGRSASSDIDLSAAGVRAKVAEEYVKTHPRHFKYRKPHFFSLCNAFCVFNGGGAEAINMHQVHEKVFRSYEPRFRLDEC